MMILLKRVKNIVYALKGVRYAIRHDISFKLEFFIGIPVVAGVLYLGRPLSELDIFIVLIAYLLILITELQNSALESALDRVHPDQHDMIGQSKDMAAGAVLLAGLFSLAVATYVLVF